MDLTKYLSRKWLMGAVGLILGVLVLLGVLTPEGQDEWVVVAEKVVGGLLAAAALLGFMVSEAKVDAARVKNGKLELEVLGNSSRTPGSRPLPPVMMHPKAEPLTGGPSVSEPSTPPLATAPPGMGPSRRSSVVRTPEAVPAAETLTSPFTDDLPHGPPPSPTGGPSVRPPGATT